MRFILTSYHTLTCQISQRNKKKLATCEAHYFCFAYKKGRKQQLKETIFIHMSTTHTSFNHIDCDSAFGSNDANMIFQSMLSRISQIEFHANRKCESVMKFCFSIAWKRQAEYIEIQCIKQSCTEIFLIVCMKQQKKYETNAKIS